MNDHEIKILQEVTAQIDYLFNEGVVFNPADVKSIELCAEQLRLIAYDATVQNIHRKMNGGMYE